VLVRISKSKRKFEIIFSSKTLSSDRTFRKIYDRLKNTDYINKEAAVLMRENKKFTAENKIFRREIKDLRKAIFEKKRKKKRGKILNFHKENEMKNQALFFNPAKIARARERAAALKEIETQQKRTATDRKMQQAITREKKARETAEKKARKETERIAAREKAAREKAAKTAEREAKKI
jgi:hypothetical protein